MHVRSIAKQAMRAAAAVVVAATGATASAATIAHHHSHHSIKHVLLISVDGLHQQDLSWFIRNFPDSALAQLARHGVDYIRAMTPFPSDSFPGMVGQVTGGDPGVTGIYYDDTFNHDVFPAGTTNCTGQVPGGEVGYEEADDVNSNSIDAGQGLSGLPSTIGQMTSNPLDVINLANLPVNATTCKPILPSQYLKVNTIFNVAHNHGMLTAWSDKHPAYQVLAGPSGTGVADFFTPEINSQAIGYQDHCSPAR
jgi:Type I phosphodiesterase / nucleotide pyrophosphatase